MTRVRPAPSARATLRRLATSVLVLLPLLAYVLNYGLFQQPVDQVLARDDRNRGMVVRAHWRWYVDPTVLIYDLRATASDATGVDVLRALLQFAYRQKDRTFDRVVLAWRGEGRFTIGGADFRELGRRYPDRSPVDTLFVVPSMLRRPDGTAVFPPPAPQPWLADQQRRLLEFNRFVNEWTAVRP
jgi:hypothetical protein